MKARNLILIAALFFLFVYGRTQESVSNAIEQKFNKHEIGISWGVFPTSGILFGVDFWMPGNEMVNGRYSIFGGFTYPWFAHYDSKEWKSPYLINEETGTSYREDEYYSMQHFGCLTFNYQYHFTKKHSIGFTASWLGRYITNYTSKLRTNEVINTKGWENIFTLCVNYRFTYYHKNTISLYTGIHVGFGLKFIEQKLLFITEKSIYLMPGIQVTGFGIEAGKRHCYVGELGFGSQGVIKMGYRYKF